MKKWHEIASEDNRFATWTEKQLWDHFIAQVVGLYYIGCEPHYHTWLRMIHRADVIPGHHTITLADGTIQAWRRNPHNDPALEQRIMDRWQQQEDILAGRE